MHGIAGFNEAPIHESGKFRCLRNHGDELIELQ